MGCSLAALLTGSARAVDPAFTQAPGSPIATGSGAIGVAIADLNGDTKADLAVANQGANNVSILLGNGTGGFSTASGSPVTVGTDPVAVVAAHFNGDTRLDLAVANENATGAGTVSILLGNGTGGFSNAGGSPVTVGTAPQSIAASDFNGDLKTDLAVANELTDDISILLGSGTGGFSNASGSPVALPAGATPQSVASGDFNGDGKVDLATANEVLGNISILLGNGLGAFAAGATVAAGIDPNDLSAADLNADGRLDLIVANAGGNNVSILLGNGTGGFSNAPGSPVAVGLSPEGTAAADFNQDGKLDVAVANAGGTDLSILVGTGTGGFTSAPSVPAGTDPTGLAAGNLNGDAKPDLVAANYHSHDITVQLNTTSAVPTAVTLRTLVARRTPQGVELRWRTAQEAGLLGFDLYRSGVKLNRTLIAARGSAATGAPYRLLDRGAPARSSATYRLQAVRADGTRAWIGRAVAAR